LTLNTQDENVPSQSVEIGQNDQSRIIAKLKQVVLLDQQLSQEVSCSFWCAFISLFFIITL